MYILSTAAEALDDILAAAECGDIAEFPVSTSTLEALRAALYALQAEEAKEEQLEG